MNLLPDEPVTVSEALCAIIRTEDAHARRYGEEPDPLVRRNGLERAAARLAWEARASGRPSLLIGNATSGDFRLEVVAIGDVCGPVAVAGLYQSDGTFVGVWPWNDGVQIWPDEMVAAGLGSIELAALESGISSMSLAMAEDDGIPWEDPTYGGEL